MDLYRNYLALHDSIVNSFKNYKVSIRTFELPEVDYTDIDSAIRNINWTISMLKLSSGGFAYENLIRDQNEALFDYRHHYLHMAILKLPKDKHVVVITTNVLPPASVRKDFDAKIINLSNNPSEEIVSTGTENEFEWIAFCPRGIAFKTLYKIFDLWNGDPRHAETKYL